MKRTIFILLLLLNHCIVKSQELNIRTATEKIYFNIFSYNPDPEVYDFIKKYFPAWTKKPEQQGGWTMYPPGGVPDFLFTTHSVVFKKHPFLKFRFRKGLLNIYSTEEKEDNAGISDIDLIFMFDTKEGGQAAFLELKSIFDKAATLSELTENNGIRIAQYESKTEGIRDAIYFVLTEDELYPGKYKLVFRIGGYDNSTSNWR